jgi:hypothetical protein
MYAIQHVIEEAGRVEFYMSTLIYVPAAPYSPCVQAPVHGMA